MANLNQTPVYTPFVASYDRVKTENGVQEISKQYLKRYYSSIDAQIYFGNYYVEDVSDIQWTVQQKNLPIYGFNSYTFDEIAIGSRIINGQFSIRFTSPNYLFRLLASAEKQNAIYNMKDYVIPVHDRILGEVHGAGDGKVKGAVAQDNHGYLWPQTFDIDVIYGHPERGNREVHIILEGVHIISCTNGASVSDPTPTTEMYQFVAKDMKTLDAKTESAT